MGSLVTALASYCDIKQKGGRWYLRIDDIDPVRTDPERSQISHEHFKRMASSLMLPCASRVILYRATKERFNSSWNTAFIAVAHAANSRITSCTRDIAER